MPSIMAAPHGPDQPARREARNRQLSPRGRTREGGGTMAKRRSRMIAARRIAMTNPVRIISFWCGANLKASSSATVTGTERPQSLDPGLRGRRRRTSRTRRRVLSTTSASARSWSWLPSGAGTPAREPARVPATGREPLCLEAADLTARRAQRGSHRVQDLVRVRVPWSTRAEPARRARRRGPRRSGEVLGARTAAPRTPPVARWLPGR